MNGTAEIESLFSSLGASFLLSGEEIGRRLKNTKAFVFDWDGVFNRGEKGPGSTSTFSEPDSMGTNLLRYAFWRTHGDFPVCAIVSGATNASAELFGQREHFHAVYCNAFDKAAAFGSLETVHGLSRDQIAYVFDDANDFSIAKDCLLRFLVRRDASPLLREYGVKNGVVDYITAARSGEYAVREVAELLIGMFGQYPDVFESRMQFDSKYQTYFSARNKIDTSIINAG